MSETLQQESIERRAQSETSDWGKMTDILKTNIDYCVRGLAQTPRPRCLLTTESIFGR
jgi:hypothetical protein